MTHLSIKTLMSLTTSHRHRHHLPSNEEASVGGSWLGLFCSSCSSSEGESSHGVCIRCQASQHHGTLQRREPLRNWIAQPPLLDRMETIRSLISPSTGSNMEMSLDSLQTMK